MPTGRFAPSPTGPLHVGNLRTAVIAWLFARSTASPFLMRIEDLDPASRNSDHEKRQLDDLLALGLDWDGPEMRQSNRLDIYRDAIGSLVEADLTFPCYCSRREVRTATLAAHGTIGQYPGTCRNLTTVERSRREAEGRVPALRLTSIDGSRSFVDRVAGVFSGSIDDVVIRRNDGTPAYNLAVVVDDAHQHVEQVVRGDDLMPSTPAQMTLTEALGLPQVEYAHVPLVLGPSGARLAKRDGAVTLADLSQHGVSAGDVLTMIARSLDLAEPGERVTSTDLVERFEPDTLDWRTWTLTAEEIFAEGSSEA